MIIEIEGNSSIQPFRVNALAYHRLLETLEICHAKEILGADIMKYKLGKAPTLACEKLANVLEQTLEENPEDDAEFKREFVTFLRTCNGFQIG